MLNFFLHIFEIRSILATTVRMFLFFGMVCLVWGTDFFIEFKDAWFKWTLIWKLCLFYGLFFELMVQVAISANKFHKANQL